ncbi:MAG: LuxR C-terminal-related transcriptional regulator [Pseudomonadota bacterium]
MPALANAIVDQVDKIDGLTTAYDVFRFTRELGKTFGAERFSVIALDDECSSISKLGLVNNWDPELIAMYDEKGLADGSPILKHFSKGTRPLDYAMDTLPQDRADQQKEMSITLFNDFGMSKGLSCPLASQSGTRGGITFSGSRLTLSKGDAFTLHLVSNYLFDRLTTVSNYAPKDEGRNPLSEREIDCLRWTARGQTSKEIARTLDISDHTVTHYLASACRKLEAANRVHAVAIALRKRFID